jgi:LuxR family transcriptional regulator, maltose regulon positive regulatory protein
MIMEPDLEEVARTPYIPLLTTKLHMPRASNQIVQRTLLDERIAQGMNGALTLISAPAGFGKTTFLSDFLARNSMQVAWLSLEAEDNDLVRFLTYVIATLQSLDQEIGRTSLPLLHSSPLRTTEPILSLLINDLESRKLPRFALVLDDYHVIEDPAIHRALTFLLDHLPAQMHLIIAARADPPLPLARLRGRGQLCEVRAADLRFAREEAQAYLYEIMHLDLTASDVALLQKRTEGWIAGIQLAALSLQGRTDVSEFLSAFSGSHRFVLDYLSEEVFSQQPATVQSFLLHTCILDRMNSSLVNAVTELTDGQAVLERLEHANLFVVSLDDRREWYRYHHLFAEALRSRLRQEQPELIPELHRRASRWYEQHGYLDEATQHTLAGSDYAVAARLIEQIARQALRSQGRFSTLLRRMEALPRAWLDTHPQLALLYAWIVVSSGVRPWSDLEPWLQETHEALPPHYPQTNEFAGEVAAIRTLAAAATEEYSRVIELSGQSLTLLPENHWTRGLMLLYQGSAFLSLEQVDEAIVTLEQAVAFNEADVSRQHVLVSKSRLAHAYATSGQLHRAMQLYQEVLQQEQNQQAPLRSILMAHGGLSDLFREWNDFSSALFHLDAGLELDRYIGGLLAMTWAIYLPLARVQLALGKQEEAFASLSHIAEAARSSSSAYSTALISAWQARFHLACGNIEAPTRWAREQGLNIHALPADLTDLTYTEMTAMTLARLAIGQERAEAALPLLDHLFSQAEKTHRTTSALELLLIQALAYETIGQREKALTLMKQAIQRAEPEGYIRLFLDEGPLIGKLLLNLQEISPQLAYLDLLLAAFPEQETRRPKDDGKSLAQSQSLIDPLSQRELEVLRLIAAGASNEEIARQLVIATSTVKRHVSNIFGKLEVSNRTQAVTRAQSLGLL